MSSATIPRIFASESDVDLRYYAQVLWRGRLIIGTAGIVGLLLGLFNALLQTPEYRSAALIQIEPPVPILLNVSEALASVGGYWQNTDFYNTQFKILKSRGVGEKAVERLKLKDREPFRSSPDAPGLLMSYVSVEPIADSRLVSLVVVHEHPQEAALWANTLADVYIEVTLSSRVEAAKRAGEWLQERLSATQKDMRESQDRLFRIYEKQDLFVPEGSASAVTLSISRLQGDFINATARRIAIEAALKQMTEMRKLGVSIDTVPQIVADARVGGYVSQLVSMNLELMRMRDKYKEGHPEVQRLQEQIEQIKRLKEARTLEVMEMLRVEFAQLQQQEAQLKSATDAQKAQATSQSRRITELETLRKEADSAKSLYDVLLQKLNETDIAASVRSNNVSLIEKAAPARSPSKPDKRRIAGLGLLIGLALGAGLMLAREFLNNTLKDPEEVERYLHLDLLASVPRYDEGSVHLVTEAYQNLRTALIFARKDEGGQVVLIAGTVPQEGKTTTLVNIGKLLAASGEKTVLIDFDLRRATLHTHLGLTREPGVTNCFVGHDALEGVIRPTRVPNLFAITAGAIPPNPPALLARKALGDLLTELRRNFDWILVDSPPLASVTDGLLLARHADTTVLVVQYNKVDKKLVKRAVGSLAKVTSSLLGVVLNAVDIKAKGYYYYYYQHQSDQSQPTETRRAGPKSVAAGKT